MSKPIQLALLFIADFVSIILAFLSWAWLRRATGLFAEPDPQQLLINSMVVFGFWLLVFIFWGLYRAWHAHSRVDEVISIVKVVSLGVFCIFLLTFDLATDMENPLPPSRLFLFTYWLLMVTYVSGGRMLLRTFQRSLLEAGIGERKAVIVGKGERARALFDEIRNFPALGYRMLGFIETERSSQPQAAYRGCPVLGSTDELRSLIESEEIDEVLIAVDEEEGPKHLLGALAACNGKKVHLRALPSLYDIAAGQARSHQIYGMPLIELMAEPMPFWERQVKRLADVLIAAAGLLVAAPVLAFAIIRVRRAGSPVFRTTTWVGEHGRPFTAYRFNLPARHDAENTQHARTDQTLQRLDRLLLLYNVLRGEMSVIGPRPETPEITTVLQQEFPLYFRRLAVRPGLIGWAQLKGYRGGSVPEARRFLQYDFIYIENMSLRIDLKILLVALYTRLFGSPN